MPRTIRTKVYKFSELSEQAKQKAIDSFRDINVGHEWWDFVYEDFQNLCETIGIYVDLEKTYFSGFSHQGQGSSFTADIDIPKLIEGVKVEAWRKYAPLVDLKFYPITKNMERFVKLSQNSDCVELWASAAPTNRETSVKLEYHSNYYTGHHNIEKADTDLEDFLQDVIETLNHWFFKSLENSYEDLTSNEAIGSTIEANDYEFTKDGRQF